MDRANNMTTIRQQDKSRPAESGQESEPQRWENLRLASDDDAWADNSGASGPRLEATSAKDQTLVERMLELSNDGWKLRKVSFDVALGGRCYSYHRPALKPAVKPAAKSSRRRSKH